LTGQPVQGQRRRIHGRRRFGRSSTSEGNYKSYRYSSLKKATDDEDAERSGTTSDPVTRQETPQVDYAQGIVTHNRFACLSQDNNITDDTASRTQPQPHEQDDARTPTHDSRRKRVLLGNLISIRTGRTHKEFSTDD